MWRERGHPAHWCPVLLLGTLAGLLGPDSSVFSGAVSFTSGRLLVTLWLVKLV